MRFIAATLGLHLVYGALVGGLNAAWVAPGVRRQETAGTAA